MIEEGERRLVVCSRRDAEAQPLPPGWVVISITDPDRQPAYIRGNPDAILHLQFDDVEEDRAEWHIAGGILWKEEVQWSRPVKLMTEIEARSIAAFVESFRDRSFLVHCEAGISRSVGVARALEPFLGLHGEGTYMKEWNRGNGLVRRLVERALDPASDPSQGSAFEGVSDEAR